MRNLRNVSGLVGSAILLASVLATPAFAQNADAEETTAIMRPAVTGVVAMSVELDGESEVPGPGDADAEGRAFLMLHPDDGKMCYAVTVSGTTPPTAAHIHEGAADESGGPVVPLPTDGGLSGCVDADVALLERISEDPDAFYVNVHTDEHPQGAVRGQLVN